MNLRERRRKSAMATDSKKTNFKELRKLWDRAEKREKGKK